VGTRSDALRLVAYTDATVIGGAEQSLANLLRALDPRIAVTVVGVDPAVVEHVAARRAGAGAEVLPPVRNKADLEPIVAHVRSFRRLQPHAVHVNLRTPWSCQYGLFAASLLRRVRIVVVEHSPIASESAVQRALRRTLNARVVAHVAVSGGAARAVEAAHGMAPGTVQVIHNVVFDEGEPPPRGAARRTVGYVGRLSHEKGADVLVEALARVPDATALLVGDGPDRAALEALAGRLGVGDRVRFEGWSDRPRTRMAEMDLLALPSRFEALPLTAVEAMLAARPVVATDVGDVSEAVDHGTTGLLVAPEDPEALAEALAELLDDPERARRMGEAGRARALERFPAARSARAFELLYGSAG